jgi:exopolyphosphatase/guanosine-5'-triphosphate,3'-diphosphate pyrophosphatase
MLNIRDADVRVAVIDVGTLKSKFEIREFRSGVLSAPIHRDKVLTVLGRDLDKTDGLILARSVEVVVSALGSFKAEMMAHGVRDYRAIATEAIRKARNADAVLAEIEARTGIRLEVLDRQSEAGLFFRSVAADFPGRTIAAADIGGGSVQVVVGRDSEMSSVHSFKTGTYFLQENFSATHHPSREDLARASEYIERELAALTAVGERPDLLVYGSTNIIDFMRAMNLPLKTIGSGGAHPYSIEVGQLVPLYGRLISLSYEDRMPLYPAEPYYMWAADKALMNIARICKNLDVTTIVPSNNNISAGILLELAHKYGAYAF